MSLSPEITARIQAVENNLALLDPILHGFCERHGYRFSSTVGVYPRRRVWQRGEIDRSLDLVLDLTVPEVMDRGFYLEMPWSLYAGASLLPAIGEAMRVLDADVFRGVPYSQLATVLPARLEEGAAILKSITRHDITERGRDLEIPS
jgi:hypothetical protein